MPSVALQTLGCKVAQYETEAIAEKFAECGFLVVPFNSKADVYVINTCTVTAEADSKSRRMIRRAGKRNPDAVIAVVGCYSQVATDEVLALGASVVLGTDNKLSVVDRVIERLSDKMLPAFSECCDLSEASFERMTVKNAPRTRAYVKIEDGCESRCSYCAIRIARGCVRSKPRADALAEIKKLSENGVREVVLTGIETGAYGKDFDEKYTLGDLIAELDSLGYPERIRLGSLAPELVGNEFAEKIKNTRSLAPHFHISMQSGSDKVLALMKRKYNSRMAYDNIMRLREMFPDAEFTTDMMVGFPGECEEDFLLSLDFISRVGFLDVHVFQYSKRRGTVAAELPGQIPEVVKHERSRRMIEHKNRVRDERLLRLISNAGELSVIAETKLPTGEYSAHADNFAEVRFLSKSDFDLKGKLVKVRPVSHKDGIIYAEEIVCL